MIAQRSTEKCRLQVLNFNRNMKVQIRKAKSEQAEVLTAIAHAAKLRQPTVEDWHEINGLHVDDTPDSVAWGLGTLLADHDRCRWMGRNGRATVDAAFGWDTIAEQTEAVYRNVA